MKPVVVNRKAKFDYFISERVEAGISLSGHEVKSIREGRINLKESFVRIVKGEAFLIHCHISPYSRIEGHLDYDPRRSRKLLLKKSEIGYLYGKSSQKGHTILPLSVYFKKGLVKMEIGVGKGKKQVDKRETIKRRIHDRESKAAIKRMTR